MKKRQGNGSIKVGKRVKVSSGNGNGMKSTTRGLKKAEILD